MSPTAPITLVPPARSEPLERLREQLAAAGQTGLLDELLPARGRVLAERFQLGDPFAIGGQALLFEAVDLTNGEPVLVKQAAFDYRRPIRHSRREAATRRATIQVEHQVLRDRPTDHLPRAIALLTAPTVVPAASESLVLGHETFLVEERIRGMTLENASLLFWRTSPMAQREAWARKLGGSYLTCWLALLAQGHFYGDTNARNLLIEEGTGRLRVVDAACVVAAADRVRLREAAPAFLTPTLHRAVLAGEPVPGTAATMLPVLARVLLFALTAREPHAGELPDLTRPEFSALSAGARAALSAMLALDTAPETLGARMPLLRSWLAP